MIQPKKMTEIEKAELLSTLPGDSLLKLRSHFLWEDITADADAQQVEIAREERDAAKEENAKLKTLMTKQYQDDERAHRVMDECEALLRKHITDEDTFLAAMADLSCAFDGEEPAVSWEDVKAEIDAHVALEDLKKEHAEEIKELQDTIVKIREECRRLLGEAADAKWDLDP